MKINDIITEEKLDEGPLDWAKKAAGYVVPDIAKKAWAGAKGGWTGATNYGGLGQAVAGVKGGYGQEAGKQDIDKKANIAFTDWNQKIASTMPGADATQLGKALKQYGTQVASYYFKLNLKGDINKMPPPPPSMTPAEVKQYFVDLAGKNQAAYNGITELPEEDEKEKPVKTDLVTTDPVNAGKINKKPALAEASIDFSALLLDKTK